MSITQLGAIGSNKQNVVTDTGLFLIPKAKDCECLQGKRNDMACGNDPSFTSQTSGTALDTPLSIPPPLLINLHAI